MKFHRSTKKTHYYNKGDNAGANRPLYLVNNNISEHKIDNTLEDAVFIIVFMTVFFGGFLIWAI